MIDVIFQAASGGDRAIVEREVAELEDFLLVAVPGDDMGFCAEVVRDLQELFHIVGAEVELPLALGPFAMDFPRVGRPAEEGDL